MEQYSKKSQLRELKEFIGDGYSFYNEQEMNDEAVAQLTSWDEAEAVQEKEMTRDCHSKDEYMREEYKADYQAFMDRYLVTLEDVLKILKKYLKK